MHPRFVSTSNSSSIHLFLPTHPLIFMSASHKTKTRNQIKSFLEDCSKLMKTRKGSKRPSSQRFLKPTTRRKMKSKGKTKTNSFPTIFSLPTELITEVLARVGATSLYDFFDVKLSCKIFHHVADDKYVIRHVSLEKFPVTPWGRSSSTKQAFFLEKCKISGHPEALYREGVVEYFSFAKVEEGPNCLNTAAKVGHLGASYVLGVILLCVSVEKAEEEQQVQQGGRLLDYVKSEKGITESRKKLKDIIKAIWVKIFLEPKPNCCQMQEQHRRRRRGWPSDNEDDMVLDCDACGCDLEVIFVCNLLRGIITY